MAIEELVKAALNATPSQRRKAYEVLRCITARTKKDTAPDLRTVNQSQAARLLGVSRGTVIALIKQGRLDTITTSAGTPRVTMRSLTAYANGERLANDKTAEQIETNRAKYRKQKLSTEGSVA